MDSIRKYIADQRLTWTSDQDRELRALRVDELSEMSRVREQLTLSGHRIDDEILARAKYLTGAKKVTRHSVQISNPQSTTRQQEWTEDESKILKEWAREHPRTWRGVTDWLPNRTESQCKERWKYVRRFPGRPPRARFWTIEEVRQLCNFAAGHDSWTENKDELRRSLPSRTTTACSTKWHDLMKAWRVEEDVYLRSLTPQDSTDWWERVAGNRNIMKGRSIEEVKIRHAFLMDCRAHGKVVRSLPTR